MHQPTIEHWGAVKRLLRYLSGTLDHNTILYRHSPLVLHAFSDVDWVDNKDDFTSTSAFIVYLGRNPMACSSTETEYKLVATTATKVRWICSLLTELGISVSQQPVIYFDNFGAINLCANPVFHSRMKHVA